MTQNCHCVHLECQYNNVHLRYVCKLYWYGMIEHGDLVLIQVKKGACSFQPSFTEQQRSVTLNHFNINVTHGISNLSRHNSILNRFRLGSITKSEGLTAGLNNNRFFFTRPGIRPLSCVQDVLKTSQWIVLNFAGHLYMYLYEIWTPIEIECRQMIFSRVMALFVGLNSLSCVQDIFKTSQGIGLNFAGHLYIYVERTSIENQCRQMIFSRVLALSLHVCMFTCTVFSCVPVFLKNFLSDPLEFFRAFIPLCLDDAYQK